MNFKDDKLLPCIDLRDIYGADHILNPRASFSDYGWLPKNQAQLDFLTGSPLMISGDMPVICSTAVCTPTVLSLLEKANLQVASSRYSFRSAKEYKDVLNKLNKHQKKMVINHPHPPGEIKQQSYWIDPQIIGFLNNKANLMQLAPSEHLPERLVLPPRELLKNHEIFGYPVVLKAATEEPNGGGYDVMICKTRYDLLKAKEKLQLCPEVVMEKFIDVKTNYCVQYAITRNNGLVYLGASEQITDQDGIYKGNWVHKNKKEPHGVVELARSIAEKAENLGYVGICGIDIIVSSNHQILVIDLNFRLNGSTPALLLKESIFRTHRVPLFLFRNWRTRLKREDFLSICYGAIDHVGFIPLSVYDPFATSGNPPYQKETYFISGILPGATKEEINEKEQLLASCGIK